MRSNVFRPRAPVFFSSNWFASSMFALTMAALIMVALTVAGSMATPASAQTKETMWSAAEKPLAEAIRGLRGLSDDVRPPATKDLALKIRQLPATENKLQLAVGLAGRATEGDPGHNTLQEVATTLAETLRERPVPWPAEKPASGEQARSATPPAASEGTSTAEHAAAPSGGDGARATPATREPAYPYIELATLVRYEHVEAALDNPQFAAALARLEADDRKREHPEFTLQDLTGKAWSFGELRGKVVLVNFWATWCPPCRKEMPDLETLYERFGPKGLVVLAISDEEAAKVEPFIRERGVRFPVLLDPGRKVNERFIVEGIPKSFVYDREGKLVAQSIDMRTQKQFLEMLRKAGLE
jgi:peroxiredoxin